MPSEYFINISSSNVTTNSTDDYTSTSIMSLSAIFLTVSLTILILLTLLGNGLVCISVARYTHLQTITNYFIVSLATADFLVGAIVLPFALSNIVHPLWIYGVVWCNIWVSLDVALCTTSVWHLFIIAIERALAVLKPYWYKGAMTGKLAAVFIITLWIISALMSILPILLGWNTTNGHIQNVDNPNECLFQTKPAYSLIVGIIAFWIPLVGMIVLHTKVVRTAQSQVKRIQTLRNAVVTPEHRKESYFNGREKKAVRTLAVIMGCFLVCWGPYIVYWTLADTCHWSVSSIGSTIMTWLGYVNSTLNPCIYAFFNTEFRKAFKQMILPRKRMRQRRYKQTLTEVDTL
ncbi:histamine H2 receptor-like [Glandiceps talaboti]